MNTPSPGGTPGHRTSSLAPTSSSDDPRRLRRCCLAQADVKINGWSMECRIVPKTRSAASCPPTGRLVKFCRRRKPPTTSGHHPSVDTGVYDGVRDPDVLRLDDRC